MKNLLNLLTACVLCLGFAVNARAQGRILSVEELNNCPTGTKIALKALSAYDKRYWLKGVSGRDDGRFFDKDCFWTLEKVDSLFYLTYKVNEYDSKSYLVCGNWDSESVYFSSDTTTAIRFKAVYDKQEYQDPVIEDADTTKIIYLKAVDNQKDSNYFLSNSGWLRLSKNFTAADMYNIYDVSNVHKATIIATINGCDTITEEVYVNEGDIIPAPEIYGCTCNYEGVTKDSTDTQVVNIAYNIRPFELNEDVTAMMKNMDFTDNKYGWTGDGTYHISGQCAYIYNYDRPFEQRCKLYPTGLYEVSLNSYYYETTGNNLQLETTGYNYYQNAVANGKKLESPVAIYANNNIVGNKCIYEESISEEDISKLDCFLASNGKYYPKYNCIDEAFKLGYYNVSLHAVVTDDGDGLNIGACGIRKGDTYIDGEYYMYSACFDNFKIIYRGKQKKYVSEALEKDIEYLNNAKAKLDKNSREKVDEILAASETAMNSGDSIAMFDILTSIDKLKAQVNNYIKSFDELYSLTCDLQNEIKGLEGDYIIAEAKTLVDEIFRNLENKSYTAAEIAELIEVVNVLHNRITWSTDLNLNEQRVNADNGKFTLTYKMNNVIENLTAFQCNLYLPEGFTIAKDEYNEYDITLNKKRVSSNHTITAEKQSDGSYLIVCYSSSNNKLRGTDGDLFYVNVQIPDNLEEASSQRIELNNCRITTTTGREISNGWLTSDSKDIFICRDMFDINNDNIVDINDIDSFALYLVGPNFSPYNARYDFDGEGNSNINDLFILIDTIQGETVPYRKNSFDIPWIDTEPIMSNKDEVCSIPYRINFNGQIIGYIFEMNGIQIAKKENGEYDVSLTDMASDSHKVIVKENYAKCYNIIVYSTKNEPLKQNEDHTLLKINTITSDYTSDEGIYCNFNSYSGMDCGGQSYTQWIYFIKYGDVNNDRRIDIHDLDEIVNIIQNPGTGNVQCDVNKDENISIVDAVVIADAVKNNGVLTKNEIKTLQADSCMSFEIAEISISDNSDYCYPICLNSDSPVTALQFEVNNWYYPWFELADEFKDTHKLVYKQDGNTSKVLIYSENNELINGEFVKMHLSTTPNKVIDIEVKNLKVCTTDFIEYSFEDWKQEIFSYRNGDTNGDGGVSVSDVVYTVSALLGIELNNFKFVAADIDKDGEITVADVVSVVNTLLSANASQEYSAHVEYATEYADEKSQLDGGFKVENATDGEAQVIVKLDNPDLYTAMQFDMQLPEGVTIEEIKVQGGHIAMHKGGRVVAYSLTNSSFDKQENVMTITLASDNDIAGTKVMFDNIYVTTTEFTEKQLKATSTEIGGGTTNVDGIEEDSRVYIENGCIVIESQNEGIAEIVSANGAILKSEITVGKNYINVEQNGVYIVKFGNRTVKVRL